MSDPTRVQATPDDPAPPTRSPYELAPDEGPQSLGALKAALAPWPDLLAQFTAELDAAPFHQDGSEPMRALRDVISAYRIEWMAKVHPDIVQAVADDEAGIDDGVPLDVVMADYDPNTYEPRTDGGEAA
ncbi:hypothetical protein [Streptomyces clavuligerus]|uniref:Uncharacterized protein n=1 Tax=Streptomyces clavuligerus TaxID=1901 RepID=Q6TMR1_STRCL|nr:hypothetical protein [Streptomyces clavuligerus]AAQ93562.1 hypothetical protein pSCL2.6.A8.8 [Streptomyces clavuligerus]AXU16857.1 hypothetical protein D1794_29275 [Streptomyces clavuligerus]EDY48723.1 conserved hypothetical protein [Streptomyces clavuligerus]MBY6300990.1 hypothetical protein [Streptomyces clavuligerus]QPJ96999.1 hypothetical protein GE265_28200 [Streptomyces clavuligerus]